MQDSDGCLGTVIMQFVTSPRPFNFVGIASIPKALQASQDVVKYNLSTVIVTGAVIQEYPDLKAHSFAARRE